ncbi:hypothetical protein Kfla_0189 [Kribbella flavida DSM 17836]|uniref:Uncharacterized protein n=1 Tax=Kribbella flavida (strain DSM 17836 / JCM 10339 / NBRC 14399) TaxID=479435 RepID=D2PRY7_KRIFD|nr:hypothetical protein [Kribbella flavida]ADB29317.1 hypothetical protein Kfla_0189 [Kribbella flavida DSM 17836]
MTAALELVGTNVLPDTLRATAVHGTVCFTGMLSDTLDEIAEGHQLMEDGGAGGKLVVRIG